MSISGRASSLLRAVDWKPRAANGLAPINESRATGDERAAGAAVLSAVRANMVKGTSRCVCMCVCRNETGREWQGKRHKRGYDRVSCSSMNLFMNGWDKPCPCGAPVIRLAAYPTRTRTSRANEKRLERGNAVSLRQSSARRLKDVPSAQRPHLPFSLSLALPAVSRFYAWCALLSAVPLTIATDRSTAT